jgi:hypothetical protein
MCTCFSAHAFCLCLDLQAGLEVRVARGNIEVLFLDVIIKNSKAENGVNLNHFRELLHLLPFSFALFFLLFTFHSAQVVKRKYSH